ncbi:hypothetical protein [Hypericibacter terrae]|uniref:hypothetical protein n=1 Tax=Hypericibacter terrae TaxID=2602015 RepID=UPI0012453DAB|nr:hypothetical protein [Hypericibacter terrae]
MANRKPHRKKRLEKSGMHPFSSFKHWLVSCQKEADLLVRVEAPDTKALGLSKRSSWDCVNEIISKDRIWFRDAQKDKIIGLAEAKAKHRGPHSHDAARHPVAIQWSVSPLGGFEGPLSRTMFFREFQKFDDGSAGFSLTRAPQTFAFDHYCYPLSDTLVESLSRLLKFTHRRFTVIDALKRDVLS